LAGHCLPVAQNAVQDGAETFSTGRLGQDPLAHLPRWIMAYMLRVAALQLGHPVLLVVLSETGNASVHPAIYVNPPIHARAGRKWRSRTAFLSPSRSMPTHVVPARRTTSSERGTTSPDYGAAGIHERIVAARCAPDGWAASKLKGPSLPKKRTASSTR